MSSFLLATTLLMHIAVSHQQADPFGSTFLDNFSNDNVTYAQLKCTGVEGSAGTCISCYNCDNDRFKSRPPKSIQRLKLKDKNCKESEVCCISNLDLVPRNTDNCGTENPEGYPRSRRPSLRSVLDRQYPWRAWIYTLSGQSQPICAATYLDLGSVRALVTTASCVNGHAPSELVAKFTKTEQTTLEISKVIPHKHFDASTHVNDIAIITLAMLPGHDVHPACMPWTPALFGTACIAVSESETYINQVIPQQQSCNNTEQSVMCVFSGSKGIKPQEGAGLFCLDPQSALPKYLFHGVYINDSAGLVGSTYTNITHFLHWFKEEGDKLKKKVIVRRN
ncbi:serine protease 56-like [Epargyreus clarus]|uniref:serine protease 56-like n=1 Tax=Epargyreus clarus TaxID=520877 RepID=UPI003C2F2BE0